MISIPKGLNGPAARERRPVSRGKGTPKIAVGFPDSVATKQRLFFPQNTPNCLFSPISGGYYDFELIQTHLVLLHPSLGGKALNVTFLNTFVLAAPVGLPVLRFQPLVNFFFVKTPHAPQLDPGDLPLVQPVIDRLLAQLQVFGQIFYI